MPETDQSSINVYKTRDLQIASVATSTATKSFSMAHKMGLIQINMAKATAPETRTYTANSVTTAYDSGNVEFYALNVFDGTNLPYSATCPGTVSYFIVKHSSGSYSFTTPYKALNNGSPTGAVSQWTMSPVTAPASGKCTSATTSDPMFKNLGRLYSYTNTVQTYTPMLTGFKYKMECWGAQGGDGLGFGGYTMGIILIEKITDYFVYVGERGDKGTRNDINLYPSTSYNGGGSGAHTRSDYLPNSSCNTSASGGGATDIRTKSGLTQTQLSAWTTDWNSTYGLRGRIMVAAGGGGYSTNSTPGAGGGINGIDSSDSAGGIGSHGSTADISGATGATQFDGGKTTTGIIWGNSNGEWNPGGNGTFGTGGNGVTNYHSGGGGGGGYWGGAAGGAGGGGVGGVSGSGGSSYISGHPGCVAIESATSTSAKSGTANTVAKATHYSGLYFTITQMIDGAGYVWTTSRGSLESMPNPITATSNYDSGVGHTGNGYARITCKPYD